MAAPDEEWLALTSARRPNSLIVGSIEIVHPLVAALGPYCLPPVFRWPADGALQQANGPATIILDGVHALVGDDQTWLMAWLSGPGRGAQVIALAPLPVYPLVERGTFLEALYYRLNEVYVDCSANPGLSHS